MIDADIQSGNLIINGKAEIYKRPGTESFPNVQEIGYFSEFETSFHHLEIIKYKGRIQSVVIGGDNNRCK